jgi:hypothetical protein
LLEDCVDLIPKRFIDDGVMLAWVGLALVDGLTAINTVVQKPVEVEPDRVYRRAESSEGKL